MQFPPHCIRFSTRRINANITIKSWNGLEQVPLVVRHSVATLMLWLDDGQSRPIAMPRVRIGLPWSAVSKSRHVRWESAALHTMQALISLTQLTTGRKSTRTAQTFADEWTTVHAVYYTYVKPLFEVG